MYWFIGALALWVVVTVFNTNDEFYTRNYSNGITIVTNKKTGQRWMKAANSTNLVEIEKE